MKKLLTVSICIHLCLICFSQEDSLRQYELKEIEIKQRTDVLNAPLRKTETLTIRDLQKDACCNLSESFENTATVDANYTDAVSGARHIRLLGLDGKYVQFTSENIPSLRGLQQIFGLTFIPGPWMQSV
ncbi:MAG: hypothetical protein NZ522_02085, partial [Chitinophagales bacterium]|nr:hypothetical protein [Chitinophagales bacterium]